MGYRGWRRNLYYACVATEWATGFAFVLITAGLKADPKTMPVALLASAITWVQQTGFGLVLIVPLLHGLCRIARKELGPPVVWDAIVASLDGFRDLVFQDRAAGKPYHHHRATLFKRVRFRFCWPPGKMFKGWLVPVARSGHTTQGTKTCFLAPDDADRAEGVAGQTWARTFTVSVDGLPHLEPGVTQDIEAYAGSTWLTATWVTRAIARGKTLPQSLYGIPVETKRGKPWGVVVLDSRDPAQIAARLGPTVKFFGRVIGKLVDKV